MTKAQEILGDLKVKYDLRWFHSHNSGIVLVFQGQSGYRNVFIDKDGNLKRAVKSNIDTQWEPISLEEINKLCKKYYGFKNFR